MDHRLTPPRFRLLGSAAIVCLVAGAIHGEDRPDVSLTPPSPTSPKNGPVLMEQIVEAIGRHPSVSAKIRHRTNLFGQRLVGAGAYLQQRDDRGRLQLRFSLSLKASDRMVNLLHVSDGRYLWRHDTLDGRPRLARIDLTRLPDGESGAGRGRARAVMSLGGGLPALLKNLKRNFVVATPQAVTFQQVPMWALALRWHPRRLRALLPQESLFDEEGRIQTELLPSQFPDRIFLLVGQDDLFPYHIDFRRTETERGLQVVGARPPSKSITTMELFEVQFDVPIDPQRFNYRPPTDIRFDDETDDLLPVAQRPSMRKSGREP